MKKILLLAFLVSFFTVLKAQNYQYYPMYGGTYNRLEALNALHIPSGAALPGVFTSLTNKTRSGALFADTSGADAGVYVWIGMSWVSIGSSVPVSNGIRNVNDTLMLGDSINRYTYIQIANSLINNSPYRQLRLGNRTKAQSLNGLLPDYFLMNTYTPVPFVVEGVYGDAFGDVDSTFYGGLINTTRRLIRDSVLTDFGAGKRNEIWAGSGYEGVNQYFPPRDTMNIKTGRDGQSGNTISAQMDFGNYFGYNVNIISPSDMPELPVINVRSCIDLIRNIDNTRIKKMTGSGFSSFFGCYKSYQTPITMATYAAGNYWEKMYDYIAYGDSYPLISGATKAYTLSVAEVNKSFGFYARPHYLYTNTVRDGYGFVARGDSDYNHVAFLNIGPYSTLPTRAGLGNKSWTRRLYVNGDMESTGNSYSFVSEAYGMAVKIPISIGTEAGINFSQTDTALVGTVAAYLVPSNREARGMYIRSEMYNGTLLPNTSTGGFVQIETGVNHANITRWHRNGNMAVGHSATSNIYRLYKKLTVVGSGLFTDTLSLLKAPILSDTSGGYDIVMRQRTGNGDLFTIPTVTLLGGATVTTQYDNNTTTLGNVPGLSYNVAAGKRYRFEVDLYTTSDVAGGVKAAIGGTATATNIIYEGLTTDAGTTTQSRATALGSAVGGVTAVTAAYIRLVGTIVVNSAGTLTVQFAENAATATSSVLIGSTFLVREIP